MTEQEREALNFPYSDLSFNDATEIKQEIVNKYDKAIAERDELKAQREAMREWICKRYFDIINRSDNPKEIIKEIDYIYNIGDDIPYYVCEACVLINLYDTHFDKGWRK